MYAAEHSKMYFKHFHKVVKIDFSSKPSSYAYVIKRAASNEKKIANMKLSVMHTLSTPYKIQPYLNSKMGWTDFFLLATVM